MSRAAEEIARQIGGSRWLQGYVRGKLRTDPVFEEVRRRLVGRAGKVADLGCGLGLLGFWLRAQGLTNDYAGCDLGRWKIEAGRAAARRMKLQDFQLEVGDMTEFTFEGAATVCLLDVLHYLSIDDQHRLLERLAAAAAGGALILIRTGVKGCGWRSAVTMAEEFWTRVSGWIRGGDTNFPQLGDLENFFRARGCRVASCPLWGRTPFSSHWLEIRG